MIHHVRPTHKRVRPTRKCVQPTHKCAQPTYKCVRPKHPQNSQKCVKIKEINEHRRISTKKLQKNVNYRKFVNYKIDGKYKKCTNMLLNSKIGLFNIKNLFLFFAPIFLLKKFMWHYNDFK